MGWNQKDVVIACIYYRKESDYPFAAIDDATHACSNSAFAVGPAAHVLAEKSGQARAFLLLEKLVQSIVLGNISQTDIGCGWAGDRMSNGDGLAHQRKRKSHRLNQKSAGSLIVQQEVHLRSADRSAFAAVDQKQTYVAPAYGGDQQIRLCRFCG